MTRRSPFPSPAPTFLPLLAFLLLPPAALAEAERHSYACDNGSRLDISFDTADGRPQAVLHFADGDIALPQVPAASGALYRSAAVRLHTRGDEALFEDDKGNLRRCSRGDAPTPVSAAKPAAAGAFIDIAGSVDYRQRIALPPDAVLIVRIENTAPGAVVRTLAEQRIELAGRQVPIPFKTTIDRDLIGPKARVAVTARLEQRGRLRFASDRAYPALPDGQPVELVLKQVGRAAAR